MFLKRCAVNIHKLQCVLMKHMCGSCVTGWNNKLVVAIEFRIVIGSCMLTGCNIFIEVLKFYFKYCRLHTVQSRVYANKIVIVTNYHSMIGYGTYFSRQLVVVGENCTAIAKATQILGREKRGATNLGHATRLYFTAVRKCVFRSNRLACIFNHVQIMIFCNFQNFFHISILSEQMYGYNGFCTWRNGFF